MYLGIRPRGSQFRANRQGSVGSICDSEHDCCQVFDSAKTTFRRESYFLSFNEQFRRLYDYGHELIKSNPRSTVQIKVQPTEQSEEGNGEEFIRRPLLPSFQRESMILKRFKN
ncbi:hypothetical protein MTR_5g081950 [Medicago truncatula]|uniref:Uncharacterized protein n=1 Tax=Medicago truncatula TaxID=3880 RepID=G7KBX9_MEDTR|nr:hypothetical protein MTR_5g081950 [Medicago truncatula]